VPGKIAGAAVSRKSSGRFEAYGTPGGEINDPVARSIDGLLDQVQLLTARIGDLETALDAKETDTKPKSSETGLEDLPVDTSRKN